MVSQWPTRGPTRERVTLGGHGAISQSWALLGWWLWLELSHAASIKCTYRLRGVGFFEIAAQMGIFTGKTCRWLVGWLVGWRNRE